MNQMPAFLPDVCNRGYLIGMVSRTSTPNIEVSYRAVQQHLQSFDGLELADF